MESLKFNYDAKHKKKKAKPKPIQSYSMTKSRELLFNIEMKSNSIFEFTNSVDPLKSIKEADVDIDIK
jgi:predicted transcriptional regulator